MKKTLSLLVMSLMFGCSSPDLTVYLSDLDVAAAFTSGWRIIRVDESLWGDTLSIGGVRYAKGLAVYANSDGHIRLDGKGGRFTAFVGVDDNANHRPSPLSPSVIFYILTNNGETVFASDTLRLGDAPVPVDIDLKGVTDLYLMVEATDEGNHNNHADWADAKFAVYSSPVAVPIETEERFILTPPPADAPRINGAKIVGASASKPFLFTIAATGERPMSFTAEELPEGLSIDASTGIITGSCSKKGRYTVPITAANAHGSCRDMLEIVVEGRLALTPYMGWNAWYIYNTTITQEIMEQNVQALYDKGFVNFGYSFACIDDAWMRKPDSDDPVMGGRVRNSDGTIRPNGRFPDMKRLTDLIHKSGMKAGIYSGPGPTTCAGFIGSYGFEKQDAQSFADWGFDLLKYDWCGYDEAASAYFQKMQEQTAGSMSDTKYDSAMLAVMKRPFALMGTLLKQSQRDIIYNLCQYGWGDVWKWGRSVNAHSWRTAGDLGWDYRNLATGIFATSLRQSRVADYNGPESWNDPDYLIVGNIYNDNQRTVTPTSLSASEQYTYMTLWSMIPAPLMFSGDVTGMDDFTRNLLCNAEVIDVNQDKAGKAGRMVSSCNFVDIWKKELHDGSVAVAVINRRPCKSDIAVDWKALNLNETYRVRDLWRQHDLGAVSELPSFEIPRHGCMLFKISSK